MTKCVGECEIGDCSLHAATRPAAKSASGKRARKDIVNLLAGEPEEKERQD
jgi:hypothetical protein